MKPELLMHLSAFKEEIKNGLDGLARAAAIYVNMLDANPEFEAEFKRECRGIVPEGDWKQLEKVGRGKLHAKFLLGGFNSASKCAVVSRLPIEEQEKALDGAIYSMVMSSGKAIQCRIEDAPVDAVRRLAKGGKIQPVAVQRELAKTERLAAKTIEPDYKLVNGNTALRIIRATTITKKQLEKILQSMA